MPGFDSTGRMLELRLDVREYVDKKGVLSIRTSGGK